MIHIQINRLIPFVNENFIAYPLWEEGKYIPFVNFWQKVESKEQILSLDKKLKAVFQAKGYNVQLEESNFNETILNYSVSPAFTDLEDGGFEYVDNSWSIEEMLSLLIIAIEDYEKN